MQDLIWVAILAGLAALTALGLLLYLVAVLIRPERF